MPASQEAATAAVRRLLAAVVDSFEKLETIVLLYRARPAPQTSDAIAAAIGLTPAIATQTIAELDEEGVIERNGDGWSYNPSGRWASNVAELVDLYDRDRIELLKIMTTLAIERVRTQAANVFAEAFLLRPRKKRDPDT